MGVHSEISLGTYLGEAGLEEAVLEVRHDREARASRRGVSVAVLPSEETSCQGAGKTMHLLLIHLVQTKEGDPHL